MNLKESIQRKLNEFLTLCKSHNVESIYAFGSSVNNNFNDETSDFDLIIEIDSEDPIVRGEKLISIWDKLEELFQRKVDLLTNSSIRNPILKKSIESTKILIYDGKKQEVSF
jgi:predicted nucleotidyltransferase